MSKINRIIDAGGSLRVGGGGATVCPSSASVRRRLGEADRAGGGARSAAVIAVQRVRPGAFQRRPRHVALGPRGRLLAPPSSQLAQVNMLRLGGASSRDAGDMSQETRPVSVSGNRTIVIYAFIAVSLFVCLLSGFCTKTT